VLASAGASQATVVGVAKTVVALPGSTGICATWQMEQVASEPGASVCQNVAPTATGKMATKATASVAQ
jgi:hypothetical protein